jgi:hypothetical protein
MRHEPSFLKDILSACRKIEAIGGASETEAKKAGKEAGKALAAKLGI